MGLLEVLAGMQAGPRGQPDSGAAGGGGMSPVTMALLGVLAYKAVKGFSGAGAGQAAASAPDSGAGGGLLSGGLGGMVGRLFGGGGAAAGSGDAVGGGLSSLLGGGGSAGSVVSSGLQNLVGELQNSGHGDAVQSWIGHGPNAQIAPNDLAKALGPDAINALAQHTGMNPDDLLASLSQHLPQLVNHLTPDGRVPTAEEASRMV